MTSIRSGKTNNKKNYLFINFYIDSFVYNNSKRRMNQFLQDILVSLIKKQELTRSCKMIV